MGHARALLRVPDEETQLHYIERAGAEGMSVRALEESIARAARAPKRTLRIRCRDQRMFVNALLSTVRSLNRAGVRAVSQVLETPDSVEVIVTLPRGASEVEGDERGGRKRTGGLRPPDLPQGEMIPP